MLHTQGFSYSSINSARSALSAILKVSKGGHNFGSHPLTTRFLKGIYETRKPQPKYTYIWDASKVLHYLESLQPLENLTLKDLTLKLVMLVLLVTGQRGQSVFLLSLEGMSMQPDLCSFTLLEHTKTSKPSGKTQPILIRGFPSNRNICPLTTLKEYIARTQPFRGDERKLFVSFIKPHKGVSRDTISRWTKSVLKKAGIDTSKFAGHSTRAAVASKAKAKDIPLDVILSTIGWSSADTFHKFYYKPIFGERTVADALLSG